MRPARYSRLRHLGRARLALLHAGDTTASEAEVTQRYGFTDLRHFVAAYRNALGAPPRLGPPIG